MRSGRPAGHLVGVGAALLLALVAAACEAGPPPTGSSGSSVTTSAEGVGSPGVGSPPATSTSTESTPTAPSVSSSPSPSALPPALPSPNPAVTAAHDPAKFGFAAKGLRGEVLAFVTTSQVDDALARLDFESTSTIAFFSLEAGHTGLIRHDARWTIWNSPDMDRLIERAHGSGTRVVISLARFAWTPAQTKATIDLLSSTERRQRLARETANEVVRRGVDGVNVDFEPIPTGQKANFTDFVRLLRRALDGHRAGYQLTFDVVGHHESYDVAGAVGPAAADAVYLMGYHFSGSFSTVAHGTSPFGGPRYDVGDAMRALLRVVRPEQLIVGLPYYGHLWPTRTSALNARTSARGADITYERARQIAAERQSSYDPVEQVRRVAWRGRACGGCPLQWFQLYFDDPASLTVKWKTLLNGGLLGTGIWTMGFEGPSGDLTNALRTVWLTSG